MAQRYELRGITFVVGKTQRTLPVGVMNDTARRALNESNRMGWFNLGEHKGRIVVIRAYDHLEDKEIEIPYKDFRKGAYAEKMPFPHAGKICVLNRSQLYEDLCLRTHVWH